MRYKIESVFKSEGELLSREKGMLWPAPTEVLLWLLIGLLKRLGVKTW